MQGIYVGDSFFPMKRQQEDIRHELYLRVNTAGKGNAPLKLCANITGKLEVDRKLGQDIADKIRKSTTEAAEQQATRRTILIDTPADLAVPSRKKKDHGAATIFRKPIARQSEPVSRQAPSTSSLPLRPESPAPVKDGVMSLRTRLIQYAAIAERTSDEAVKALGGANPDANARQEILTYMGQVAYLLMLPTILLIGAHVFQIAEKTQSSGSDNANASKWVWRLKPATWLETRPYEWPKLTADERINMAKSARDACRQLKIPSTEAIMDHFRY